MTADGALEIDLYDNIDEDFVQEYSDLTELYDDVITPSSKTSRVETAVSTQSLSASSKATLSTSSNHSGKRVALYVGHLTWWTTDQDLLEAANGVGINDVIEVKFHENRQNGQSKGFCVMVFGSEQSVVLAMEKLPKVEIHGQNPVVTQCTKQNLNLFEKAAGAETQPTPRTRTEDSFTSKISTASSGAGSSSSRVPPPLMATPTMPASLGFSLRNNSSLMGQAITNIRQIGNSVTNSLQQALVSQSIQSSLNASHQLTQLSNAIPAGTNVLLPPVVPPMPLTGSTPMLPTAFGIHNALPTSLANSSPHVTPSLIPHPVPVPSGVPPPLMQIGTSGNQTPVRPQQFDNYGRPVIHTYTPTAAGKLSEAEFEDILQRNKTVSSSAINRAVQDAASGDYASAIETLVTAISLIKQSKISNDDRCKILINSLQDTLHGIESKSYGLK
ncbi:Cleavage and polyadenylation specificity factor subunit 7 [Fasciolopsis buskii]|uniref:Cleavage and polyadenylation specificity factor subunit 6 n=1 Tax=Fasciolopsis buskii TaxID=27845 RepID=A0A8E0VPB8_9TREM|nr:Cleavage and polyadenylation specificity factor subunit 7 [Fasciolopsis buski]